MKQQVRQTLKKRRGASLAEFAVVVALMAALAASAAPKFSAMTEGTKDKKSEEEMDKLLKAARGFYNEKSQPIGETAISEGRGRFPGQEKFNIGVGGYATEFEVFQVIGGFDIEDPFNNYQSSEAENWVSVFGIDNPDAPIPPDAAGVSDDIAEGCVSCASSEEICCTGAVEWLDLFGANPVRSPYQDGHYMYVVIPGSGTGSQATAPRLFLADLENPAEIMQFFMP